MENARSIPKDNRVYAKQGYWNERFQSETSYDWLTTYKDVAALIEKYVEPHHRILVVGCGNSSFSPDLYQAGFQNIVNIDFSSVVIERMQTQHADKSKMEWKVADMTKLDQVFSPASFDIVIDKAAMDALMCDEGDVWSPKPEVVAKAHTMCSGITHILKPEGTFVQISFGQPHFRSQYLIGKEDPERKNYSTNYRWTFTYHNIDIGLGYFFYVLQK